MLVLHCRSGKCGVSRAGAEAERRHWYLSVNDNVQIGSKWNVFVEVEGLEDLGGAQPRVLAGAVFAAGIRSVRAPAKLKTEVHIHMQTRS